MTIPPIEGGGSRVAPLRIPVLTAPVSTGVPPLVGDDAVALPQGQPALQSGSPSRDDAPISLAGRLDVGDLLPDTTQLALALESATRALQNGRADTVLSELDAVWSSELASDSPWYLRSAALQLLGRVGDAEQVMRAAIERLPRSAALLYLLGVHTAWRGQLDAARLANDHALTLHPSEPLLWLQRAALSRNGGLSAAATAALDHVLTMEPAFPAEHWLATLVRVGEQTQRAQTPRVQRAIERLTPSSVSLIADRAAPPATAAAPYATTFHASPALDAAARYGLSLLESPTQSARTATHAVATGSISAAQAAVLARSVAAPTARAELPAWESLVLVAGLIAIVSAPPLRIPALIVSGAMLILLASRWLR
jgi:tetratricopeptide (TPR) repeat protein